MNLLFWLMIGGILGCLVNVFLQTNPREGLLLDVIVGMVGAVLGGLVLAPLFGMDMVGQGNLNAVSMLIALIGAAILLGVLILFRRRTAR